MAADSLCITEVLAGSPPPPPPGGTVSCSCISPPRRLSSLDGARIPQLRPRGCALLCGHRFSPRLKHHNSIICSTRFHFLVQMSRAQPLGPSSRCRVGLQWFSLNSWMFSHLCRVCCPDLRQLGGERSRFGAGPANATTVRSSSQFWRLSLQNKATKKPFLSGVIPIHLHF